MSFNRAIQGILAACLLMLTVGCGGYGKVSLTAYEYAKGLYSIANRKQADLLDQVEEKINADVESGELSAKEADWLRDIIEQARDGDWPGAQKQARRIMEDQVSSSSYFAKTERFA